MTNENMNVIENEAMNLTEDTVVDTEATYDLPSETNVGGGLAKSLTKLACTIVVYKVIEKGVKKTYAKIKAAVAERKAAKAAAKAEREAEPEIEVEIVEDVE